MRFSLCSSKTHVLASCLSPGNYWEAPWFPVANGISNMATSEQATAGWGRIGWRPLLALPSPRCLAHPGLSRAGPPPRLRLVEPGVHVAAGMVTEYETNKADLHKLVAFNS